MSMVILDWSVVGGGSATLAVSVDDSRFQVGTTYIGDGLGSLVGAALDLLRGSRSAVALLPDEPSGTWFLLGGAGEEVGLQIVRFPDIWGESRWDGGVRLWFGRVSVLGFAEQVRAVADSALQFHGSVDAYRDAWGGIAFPQDDFEELSSRLDRRRSGGV